MPMLVDEELSEQQLKTNSKPSHNPLLPTIMSIHDDASLFQKGTSRNAYPCYAEMDIRYLIDREYVQDSSVNYLRFSVCDTYYL